MDVDEGCDGDVVTHTSQSASPTAEAVLTFVNDGPMIEQLPRFDWE
jgi:hypothetical protein